MTGAEWIWYNGDFELYHSIKMHNRREEFDCPVPPFWALSAPYPNASFGKAFHADGEDSIRVITPHRGYAMLDGKRYPIGADMPVTPATTPYRSWCWRRRAFPASISTAATL